MSDGNFWKALRESFYPFDNPNFDESRPVVPLYLSHLRATSLQLEQFRVGDFSSMERELASWMPEAVKANAAPRLVKFDLTARVCSELGERMYIRQPLRRWSGATGFRRSRLEEVLEHSGWGSFQQTTAGKLVAQQYQIISVDPVPDARRVRLLSWSPFEVDVVWDDPLETDIRRAREVRIMVPIQRLGQKGSERLQMGWRVYTQTEAYTVLPPVEGSVELRQRPIFDKLEHGFNEIPLRVQRRRESAIKGKPFPPPAEDLQSVHIGIMLGYSHVLQICQMQCFGQGVLTGRGAKSQAKNLAHGVSAVTLFDPEVDDAETPLQFTFVQPDPPIERYLKALDATAEYYGTNRYLVGHSLIHSSGITGDAKAFERQDAEDERQRVEKIHRHSELEVAQLVQRVHDRSAVNLEMIGEIKGLEMDFVYPQPRTNSLQEAQADKLRDVMGEDDPIARIARKDGVTLDVARQRWLDHLKVQIEAAEKLREAGIGVAPDQGLDKLAPDEEPQTDKSADAA